MFRNIVLSSFLMVPILAFADYVVYPQGGGAMNSNRINIPEPGCASDVSVLDDGMYILCSQDDNVEYPVVNGKVFKLTKAIPDEAFDCPLGANVFQYNNRNDQGYAFNDEATKIALMAGVNVYTPLSSWLAITIAPSSEDAKGSVKYKRADGSTGASLVRTNAARGSLSSNRRNKRLGDEFSLNAPSSTSTGAYYHSSGNVTSMPAYKACLFNG